MRHLSKEVLSSSKESQALARAVSLPKHTSFQHRGSAVALNVVLVIAACTIALIIVETFLRVRHDVRVFSLDNFYVSSRDLFGSAYPAEYDPALGWIPKVGFSSEKNVWETQVTILADGTRSNGPLSQPLPDHPPILAVGDSFTFGDEVSDDETWPAQLEAETGRRVVNAGVFGYGLDQTVLRAEKLVPVYKPSVLIVSFIADDISRCRLSERTNVGKPYFLIEGQRLVLENVPVPKKSEKWVTIAVQKPLGYSYLVHFLMMRLAPRFWLEGKGFWEEQGIENTDPRAVACLLMGRLKDLATSNGLKIMILGQRERSSLPENDDIVAGVIGCADRRLLQVLDLTHELSNLEKADPKEFSELYGSAHMTKAGNAWVAKRIAANLEKGQLAHGG